jgi:hypothetical protein
MRKDDNLATFMCRFSRNSDNLKLLEPKGLASSLMGLKNKKEKKEK